MYANYQKFVKQFEYLLKFSLSSFNYVNQLLDYYNNWIIGHERNVQMGLADYPGQTITQV
jgi:hypothetical protein